MNVEMDYLKWNLLECVIMWSKCRSLKLVLQVHRFPLDLKSIKWIYIGNQLRYIENNMCFQKYTAKSKVAREDGLLSAQMLNGIPEVDLGMRSKLTNIERTEAAKRIMGMLLIKLQENLCEH